LRSVLSSLRGTLEEAATPPRKTHFLTEGDTLVLDPELELDLHALEAAYTLARSNPRTEDLAPDARLGMLRRLRAGAEAYRGAFLGGFSLDDAPDFDFGVDAERETLRGRMNLVYDRLSKIQLESGELRDVIATAVRWTRHAPLSEEAHRRLMEAQFAAGDRSGVLDTYQTFRTTLSLELGIEPGPETETLAAHARGAVLGHGAPQPIARPRPETRRTLLSDMPFVGRSSEEFDALVEGYQAAQSGEVRAVVLLGDAGIGKTRLVEKFLHWAREEGADVLDGRMYEVGTRLPYGNLSE
jgi:DNA-binding SARP family transcriptional activator